MKKLLYLSGILLFLVLSNSSFSAEVNLDEFRGIKFGTRFNSLDGLRHFGPVDIGGELFDGYTKENENLVVDEFKVRNIVYCFSRDNNRYLEYVKIYVDNEDWYKMLSFYTPGIFPLTKRFVGGDWLYKEQFKSFSMDFLGEDCWIVVGQNIRAKMQEEVRKEAERKRKIQEEIERKKKEAERKREEEIRLAEIKNQPKDIQILIIQGKIRLGMTTRQIILSWGRPNKINTTVGSWGNHEQWVYEKGWYAYGIFEVPEKSKYLYFENGILTSFQY